MRRMTRVPLRGSADADVVEVAIDAECDCAFGDAVVSDAVFGVDRVVAGGGFGAGGVGDGWGGVVWGVIGVAAGGCRSKRSCRVGLGAR
jgi:hypothetical protein